MAPKRGPPLTTPSKCFPISIATQTSSARQSCRLELRRAAPDLIPRMCLPCNRLRVSSHRLARRTSGSFPGPNIRVLTRGSPGHSRLPGKRSGKFLSLLSLPLPSVILRKIIVRLRKSGAEPDRLAKLRQGKVLLLEPQVRFAEGGVDCGVIRGKRQRGFIGRERFIRMAVPEKNLAEPVKIERVLRGNAHG